VVSFTPLSLYPGEETPGTLWIGISVGPRAGLDAMQKKKNPALQGIEPGSSLYRLNYTLSFLKFAIFWDVIPCSLVEAHGRFGGIYCSAYSVLESVPCTEQAGSRDTELHGIITQKTSCIELTNIITSTPPIFI
jgi:hypothetical protein